jgi:glutamyl-tRNA reductase
LNTCNRLEIYIISDKIDETVDVITDQLRTYSKLSADEL